METHGPLGTIWVGLGLIAFYIALTWVNLLLGHFLTPLFIIPGTWVMDAFQRRRGERTATPPAGATVETPNRTNVGA